ncbi:Ankyrin repeat-containing domain protein [Niveomyces insectorum RCEF 264]|uniref:Ankyrin repeat-containing domain protein n=1 Tax=Niveomyces insectorum RCEF 264 TaxID=1081102 RepID=A0A167PUZ2_9HYPO|nr:Ankyrin repeat-containing domain protein [Niveomyces insectorum RCEF 264]
MYLPVEGGADILSKDKTEQTPLAYNVDDSRTTVLQLLFSWVDKEEHESTVHLLLQKGASIDSREKCGCSPLLWTARYGHEAVVSVLLEGGAGILSTDKEGRTPLVYAYGNRHFDAMRLLQKQPNTFGVCDQERVREGCAISAGLGPCKLARGCITSVAIVGHRKWVSDRCLVIVVGHSK